MYPLHGRIQREGRGPGPPFPSWKPQVVKSFPWKIWCRPPPPPPATRLEKRSETRDIKSTLYFQILGSRYIKALFTSEKMVEETACHPVRGWLSNYSDVCNFTLLNGGASWYCVKPSNRALLCEDWTSVRTGTPYQMFPLTHTEYKILR